jgi:DNA-binding NarL/FixJ family response regulator
MKQDGRTRILLVDDHESFRRYVSAMLQEQPDLQIIGEVGDGPQAVLQAEALQPDLILLDVGLPGFNGIEAARRFADVASKARIIFLSQESAPEVVEEAFVLGAWAYITKAHAGSELLPAIEAVSRGDQFLNGNYESRAAIKNAAE